VDDEHEASPAAGRVAYVDLGMIFDLTNFRPGTQVGNVGGGVSDAGYNVHSIAISVPIQKLTANGTAPTDPSDPNAIVSMWSSTWRQKNTTLSGTGAAPSSSGDWVQVSRIGNPLVNEVVIPLGMKDTFNATYPVDDAQYGAFVLEPWHPPRPLASSRRRATTLVLVQASPAGQRPGEVIS
jgi:hypothetical protein